MKEKPEGAWLSLNTSYYAAPIGDPLRLMEDAEMLLRAAHGVVHLMHRALQFSPSLDPDTLIESLKAVETMLEMSAGSSEVAYVRCVSIGDGWIGSRHEED